MPSNKVLIAVEERMINGGQISQHKRALAYARQICRTHGYEAVVRMIRSTSQSEFDALTTDDYAFAIVPRIKPGNNWHASSKMLDFIEGSFGITTIILSAPAWGVSSIEGGVGTIRHQSGSVNAKLLWGDLELYTRGQPQRLDGAKDVVALAVDASDEDNVYAWRLQGDNGAVYCDSSDIVGNENYGGLFPMLLQEAVNRGDITAPPKKATAYIDLDDFPDATNTLGDAETLYALMQLHNIPLTIGINPVIDATVDDDILSYIAPRISQEGGLFYPITHNTSWLYNASKSTLRANLEGSTGVGYLQSKGMDIPLHQGRYTYHPNNQVADDYLQLCKEYGVKVIRTDGAAAAATGIYSPAGSIQRSERRGVRIVGSKSPFNSSDNQHEVDSADEILSFLVGFGNCTILGAYADMPFYFHGTEMYIGHTSETAPGYRFLERYGAMVSHCRDVMRFGHPSELAYSA